MPNIITDPSQTIATLFYLSTVTLTDAQTKTLPTTGVELVAAPGVGKAIVPVSALCIANLTVAYVFAPDSSFQLLVGPGYASSPILINEFMDTTGIYVAPFLIPLSVEGTGNFVGTVLSRYIGDSASCDNQPLKIKDDFNSVANYTGGDLSNTLKITVYYIIVDL